MKKQCFFIILLLVSLESYSQIVSTLSADFASSVPSLDMFISRFNGTKHNPYALEHFSGEELRKADIVLLLDFNYVSRSDMTKQQAMEFAEFVTDNGIMLSLLDPLFFLEVQCPVMYNGKKNTISLVLQAKPTSSTTYKWNIVDAHGEMLELAKKDTMHIIYPHEHSLNFMKMISLLERYPSTITSLVADDCSPDALTSLCTLVNDGLLTLKSIPPDNIVFHFLQIPGYAFTAKRQFREGGNSGWLINNLEQCSEEQKQDYVNRLTPHRIKTCDNLTLQRSVDTEKIKVKHFVHDYYDKLNGYLAECYNSDSSLVLLNEATEIISYFKTPSQVIINDMPAYLSRTEYADSISLYDYVYELGDIAKSSNVTITVTVNDVDYVTDTTIYGEAYQVSLFKMISIDGDVSCHSELVIYNVNDGKISFYLKD